MKWTNEKPKQEGWWWYQERGCVTVIVEVIFNGLRFEAAFAGSENTETVESLNGQWSDQPIPKPTP